MRTIKLKSGIAEVYSSESEIKALLSARIDDDRVIRQNEHLFQKRNDLSHYIKEIVKIIPYMGGGRSTLHILYHWNYDETFEKRTPLNLDTYSMCFAHTTFCYPNEFFRNAFLEYYDRVRNDENVERILSRLSVGKYLYFEEDGALHKTRIRNVEPSFGARSMVFVGVGRSDATPHGVILVNDNGLLTTVSGNKFYLNLSKAKEACRETLKEEAQKIIECAKELKIKYDKLLRFA